MGKRSRQRGKGDGGEPEAAAAAPAPEAGDEGVGIPPEEVARIGERFFRARTAAGVEGTGLGLAITRELVDRLDGRLEVESAEGVGSTFRVRLPAA